MSLRRSTRSRLRAAFQDRESRADLWRALAAGEAVGAADLEVLARRHDDEGVRNLAVALADDSRRHAGLLEAHADTISAPESPATTRPFNFTQGPPKEADDCRGYPAAQCAGDIDTIPCLATLKTALGSSEEIYESCMAHSLAIDPTGVAVCRAILEDLREHTRSVESALATQQEGNPHRVREAVRAARRSPFMARWRRVGVHSGAGFSRGFLYVLYYTLLVPFGLISRRAKAPVASGDAASQGTTAASQLRSQY